MNAKALRDLEQAQNRHRRSFANSKLYTLIQLVLGVATYFMVNTRWSYAFAAAVAVWFVAGLPRIIVFVRQNEERDRLLDKALSSGTEKVSVP
jgi:hypothetical protein